MKGQFSRASRRIPERVIIEARGWGWEISTLNSAMAATTFPRPEFRSIRLYAFLRGESPEGIVESFPALNLEQAYGAIAFYLAHQQTVDAHLQKGRADFERMREEARRKHPALYAKLEAARRTMPSSRA